MKKYLICIITTILLFSCLGMTALADETAPTISDDYQTVYLNGETYSRFNASMIDTNYYIGETPLALTESQQEIIANTSASTNSSKTFLQVNLNFADGATMTAYFLRDDFKEKYYELLENPSSIYVVNFRWPDDNRIDAPKSLIMANPVTLYYDELNLCDWYPVIADLGDGSSTIHVGSLLISSDRYYYVDYKEIGVTNPNSFKPDSYGKLPAYEITDPTLVTQLRDGEEAFYGDSFGFLYDDDFTNTVSAIFLILIFAVVPAVILVLFLILAIRSKTIYRKLFSVICGCAGAELVIFTIVAMILYM